KAGPDEWEAYRESLIPRLQRWTKQDQQLRDSGTDQLAVTNHSTALLTLAIKQAAAETIGARYVYPKKFKPWIDKEVISLIHERDDLLALANQERWQN